MPGLGDMSHGQTISDTHTAIRLQLYKHYGLIGTSHPHFSCTLLLGILLNNAHEIGGVWMRNRYNTQGKDCMRICHLSLAPSEHWYRNPSGLQESDGNQVASRMNLSGSVKSLPLAQACISVRFIELLYMNPGKTCRQNRDKCACWSSTSLTVHI